MRFLKAVAAPYKTVRFVPTGGIDRANFLPYLTFPPTLAVGGSWMVKAEIIRRGSFDTISGEVTTAVREMLDIRVESAELNDPEVRGAVEESREHCTSRLLPARLPRAANRCQSPSDKEVLLLSTPFLDRVTARLMLPA